MLRSGAMLYAVFICFLISLLFSGIILVGYLNSNEVESISQNLLLIRNVESFYNSQNLSDLKMDDSTTIDLYSDESVLLRVKSKPWGMFDIVECSSEWRNSKYSRSALIGTEFDFTSAEVLYLCDNRQALMISGKTIIKGNCRLPERGIRTNFIEGTGFTGDKKVDGIISQSKPYLPEIDKDNLLKRHSFINEYNYAFIRDNFYDLNPGDSLINSFANGPLIVHCSEILIADKLYIKGNVILTSDKEVVLKSNLFIADAVVIAPSVLIEKGFSGTLQILATDSVIIQPECSLFFPSIICLVNKEDDKQDTRVVINEESVFCGTIISNNTGQNQKSNSLVSVGSEVKVYGEIYCNDAIEIKGELYGSAYCKKLVHHSKTSIYENQLLNATLDFYKLPDSYSGVTLFKEGHKRIIKWL